MDKMDYQVEPGIQAIFYVLGNFVVREIFKK